MNLITATEKPWGMTENPYFKRSEFECACGCGGNTVDFKLLEILTALRSYFDSPMIITSAYRCADYNKRIGGSPKSQHLVGKAADIQVVGSSPDEVADLLERILPDWAGIGRYNTFTHFDVRCDKARWDHRS